ncbi:MAG: Fur family transcriptional regulator [Verrucomicrobiales bacterium]|nr:Fur family transcriptional regulator [Verrucomicrobiales bacterium]
MRHQHCHSHAKKVELPTLTHRLRQSSRKVTGAREAILDLLRQHPHPMTNREISELLPSGLCDLVTIYRSMHLLEKLGLVKSYHFGDRQVRYELINTDNAHHHHLICKGCGLVLELKGCFLKELERAIEGEHGFKGISHNLEFFGMCLACQKKKATA